MRRLAVLLGVLVLALVGMGMANGAIGKDPRLGDCAGPNGKVKVAFDLARARDIWLHVPGFKLAPELETDDAAHVVVFDGPMKLGVAGSERGSTSATSPQSGSSDNVMCVAVGGNPTYYVNVDLSVVKP